MGEASVDVRADARLFTDRGAVDSGLAAPFDHLHDVEVEEVAVEPFADRVDHLRLVEGLGDGLDACNDVAGGVARVAQAGAKAEDLSELDGPFSAGCRWVEPLRVCHFVNDPSAFLGMVHVIRAFRWLGKTSNTQGRPRRRRGLNRSIPVQGSAGADVMARQASGWT